MQFTVCSLEDIIVMSSMNPAEQLKQLDRKGSIAAKRKDANIVILNENNNIVMTFCRGELAYKEEEN